MLMRGNQFHATIAILGILLGTRFGNSPYEQLSINAKADADTNNCQP